MGDTEKKVLEITYEIFLLQDQWLTCADPNYLEFLNIRIKELEIERDIYLYEILKREGYII